LQQRLVKIGGRRSNMRVTTGFSWRKDILIREPDPVAGSPARSIRSSARSSASAPLPLEALYDLLMAYDAAFTHLFKPLANQRVLVGVQLDVVGSPR
jgi:hypothetical protein